MRSTRFRKMATLALPAPSNLPGARPVGSLADGGPSYDPDKAEGWTLLFMGCAIIARCACLIPKRVTRWCNNGLARRQTSYSIRPVLTSLKPDVTNQF